MQLRWFAFVLSLLLFFSELALAHEGGAHGKPIMGYVIATDTHQFTVKVENVEIEILMSDETEYSTGNGSEKTSLRPKKGDHVMVYGTKLESGQVVASEIMIHQSPE